MLRIPFVILAAGFLVSLTGCQTDISQHPAVLRAVASADPTDVHPDSVFDVTVSLENVTDTTQTVKIPDCGWDTAWKSSNRHVTWDLWDCDSNDLITVEIQPHQSYEFPKPLKMFVEGAVNKSQIQFKMGFKTSGNFGKVLWSDPITLDVTP